MKAPKPPLGALWLHEIEHDGASHDQTKAAAVPERAKCARLSSAHAHQGRDACRPDRGPQQREGKAAPRLEWLSRVARASGGALRSVRLQMGGAPRRSLPRGTGWVMRVKAPLSHSQAFAKSYGIICPSRTVSGVYKWHRVRTGRGTFGFRWSLAPLRSIRPLP